MEIVGRVPNLVYLHNYLIDVMYGREYYKFGENCLTLFERTIVIGG